MAGLALVGCGGGEEEEAPPGVAAAADAGASSPEGGAEAAGASPAVAGATAAVGPAQRGGVLRLHAALREIDLFDIHRSQFPLTQRFSALQQSRLLRYTDANTGALEGDLVAEWETPDETSYVLVLRPGVRWWAREPTNGRAFQGEDVRLNIERQVAALDASGVPDGRFLRQGAYERVAAVELADEGTVVLRTPGPDGTLFASVLAGPWSFLQAPEAWEIFGDRMRDDPLNPAYYTGTGPFQVQRFEPEERALFHRNGGYFRGARPYLEGVEMAHLPTAAGQEAAYRMGAIDVWSPGDPGAIDGVLAEFPEQEVSEHPLAFGVQLGLSSVDSEGNPFRDRRLALAVHLALDRDAVMRGSYGEHAGLSGPAPWFAAGWATDVFALRELPGYRPQPSEPERAMIRQLAGAAAAAGVVPLTLPDIFEGSFPGIGEATAAALSDRLGLMVRAGTARYARAVEGLGDGSVPLFLGWGEAAQDADPTLDLLRTVHSEGASNWGRFRDASVDGALETMAATVDRGERQRLFRETVERLLLETPAWVVNVGHGIQRSVHRPSLALPRFGFGWDGQLLEEAWRTDPG